MAKKTRTMTLATCLSLIEQRAHIISDTPMFPVLERKKKRSHLLQHYQTAISRVTGHENHPDGKHPLQPYDSKNAQGLCSEAGTLDQQS